MLDEKLIEVGAKFRKIENNNECVVKAVTNDFVIVDYGQPPMEVCLRKCDFCSRYGLLPAVYYVNIYRGNKYLLIGPKVSNNLEESKEIADRATSDTSLLKLIARISFSEGDGL